MSLQAQKPGRCIPVAAIVISAAIHAAVLLLVHAIGTPAFQSGVPLRTTVWLALTDKPSTSLATSGIPGGGKSTGNLKRDRQQPAGAPPAPPGGADVAATEQGPVYLVQDYLTKQPVPKTEIVLDDIPPPDRAGSFQMRLWISEKGSVAHVEADSASAPESFVVQVAERFAASTFEPGELNGAAVPSIIRIEVTFGSRR